MRGVKGKGIALFTRRAVEHPEAGGWKTLVRIIRTVGG